MVGSLYDPSSETSLSTIVVGKPLVIGESMYTVTVLVLPKISIEALNLMT